MDKKVCLSQAIDIIKLVGQGHSAPARLLEDLYYVLVKLHAELEK